jgi:hypothetical protein
MSECRIRKEAEKTQGGWRCAISTNTHGRRLSFVLGLVAIAKQDAPTLTDDDIEVVVYGGERRRKMYGVEFDSKVLPEGYTETTLELLLG